MLAKITSKNQITIPKKIMNQLPETEYFDVVLKDGIVTLKPLVTYDSDLISIREKMKKLNLGSDAVREAVAWARKNR